MGKKATVVSRFNGRFSIWNQPKTAGLVLFFLAVFLYTNTLNHDYTQDDAIVIYQNMFTTQGIEGIPGILQNDTFYGFFKEEGKDKLVVGGRYRPLTQVMFAIEWELFGRNPFAGHLINLLLYAFLVFLLYKTLLRLFNAGADGVNLYFFVFLSALLFAVHPVHTEVVANIKGRDEIMTLLLSIATLWLVLRWIDAKKSMYLLMAAPVFLAALLSKENAITFVLVIPLAVLLFRKIPVKKHLLIAASLLGTSLVFLMIRASVLGWGFGGQSMELMNNPFLWFQGGRYVEIGWDEKMATIFYTLGKYVQLLVFPHPLTHDYYPRHIAIMSWTDWRVVLSLLLYIASGIYAVLAWKKHKILSFGILFYLITLSIVSNIVFPIGTNMSERFLFMPSVGFVVVAGWLFSRYFPKNRWLITGIITLLVVLFSFKTITRNQVWKNDFTLFTTDVKTSENSAKVLNAAGGALVDKAREEKNPVKKSNMLKQAIGYLNRAIKIHPTYKNAYLILGNARYYEGNFTQAIAVYDQVLSFAPGFEEAEKNLAIAHREAGKDYGMNQNDLETALFHLRTARQMLPDDYETIRLYGIANALSGNLDEAIEAFKKGIDLQPENAGAYLNLGNAYYNKGDVEKGEQFHKKAFELDPTVFDDQNQRK